MDINKRKQAVQWLLTSGNLESGMSIAFNVLKLLDEAEQDFFKIQRLAKNNEEVIILRGIDKAFPTNRFHLRNVDAEFKLGEITGIVGPKP